MHETCALAQCVAQTQFMDVPASLVDDGTIIVLDTFGASLLGAGLPWSERLRATMQTTEAAGPAAVWGTRLRFSAPTAAMLNDTAVHGFTNADNVFEAEYGGFCAAHTGNRRPPADDLTQLTKNLGSDYHTLGVNFKMWARRVPNHATLEAIKALRQKHPIPPEEDATVLVAMMEPGR
jgi:2-methylcitrate dehydratase PrpD